MKAAYNDILEATNKKPQWYDVNGVPRFNMFIPDDVPCIYADEAVLYEIECQNCGAPFLVAEESKAYFGESLASRVKDHRIHYGDPPIHGCTGDTMNSIPKRIVEFWAKDRTVFEWKRVPELEVPFPDDEVAP